MPFRNHLMSIALQMIPRSLSIDSVNTAETIMRSEGAGGARAMKHLLRLKWLENPMNYERL